MGMQEGSKINEPRKIDSLKRNRNFKEIFIKLKNKGELEIPDLNFIHLLLE